MIVKCVWLLQTAIPTNLSLDVTSHYREVDFFSPHMQAQILGQIQSFLPCRTRAVAGGCVVVRNVVPSEEAISAKAAAEEHLVDRGWFSWVVAGQCHEMSRNARCKDFDGFCAYVDS